MGIIEQPQQPEASAMRAAVLADTRAKIAANGWTVIAVFATAAQLGPSFAYTVGLSEQGLPELSVYGLPGRVAHSLLNEVARRMVGSKCALQTGERIEGVLVDDVALVAVAMSDARELNLVREIYGSVAAAVQVVWPDANGLLPWENGAQVGDDEQPVRGNPPEARPVYRAARLPVSTAQELADLLSERESVIEFPGGSYDPQRDNDIRANRGALALVGYAQRVAGGSLTDEAASAVSDLRHLCDGLGVDWEAAVASSDTNYRDEILGL
ncbi:DUF4262 domain-containing protein [Mycolicibacterium sp. Y3]